MPYYPPPATTADPDALTVGEEIFRRTDVSNKTAALTSGTLRLSYWTARKTQTVNSVRVVSGDTAAGATPTLCRMGVYSVAGDGAITLLGATANDTGLWAASQTRYTRALTTPVSLTAGQRYAVGFLVVTVATAPTSMGGDNNIQTGEMSEAPRLCALVASQTDLPASVASPANAGTRPYAALLP